MMKNRKIVLIMTDSQRWDFVNCYRKTGLKTPCIDKLASEGIRYERAYTTQPVCQPARAGIFTGQFPHSCGSWTNSMGISDNTHTVGERLQKSGVHTAYIGKWHLDGGDYFGLGKCPKGWDDEYWFDMKNYLDNMTQQERLDSRNTGLMSKRDFPTEFTYGHQCSDKAIDFLEKFHDEDFFLTVSYDEPHDPSICPPPYSKMYEDFEFPISENVYDDMLDKPEHQRVWGEALLSNDKSQIKLMHPAFFGCNSYVDSEIGRVVDAVSKYAPDAIIIYTSDHGDMLCSHNLHGKGPATYDEITRIPFIIKGKDIPKGVVDKNPVSHINITPTILALMGCEIPNVIDGKSLVPQLMDQTSRVNEYVFTEFTRYEQDHDGFGGFQPLRCVFDGRYKLTINLLTSDELYDLETDSQEMINLIETAEFSQIRDSLHDAILENMNNTRDPFRGYYWERRPWRTDASKSTWDYTLMTRQREEEPVYEDQQLDYRTGLTMTQATRHK